ncbi:MAG: hypothetical protein ACLFMX_07950 [Halobacteriales archaeon]
MSSITDDLSTVLVGTSIPLGAGLGTSVAILVDAAVVTGIGYDIAGRIVLVAALATVGHRRSARLTGRATAIPIGGTLAGVVGALLA